MLSCRILKSGINVYQFCCRKRDFRALATLNQVQGDENHVVIPNLFQNRQIEVDKPRPRGPEPSSW